VFQRNCGPVSDDNPILRYNHTLLLREVKRGGKLGPIFWASFEPPVLFKDATKKFNILTLSSMEKYVREDVAAMRTANRDLLCPTSDASFKCEICQFGCQMLAGANISLGVGAERAYWTTTVGTDVMGYRCSHPYLASAARVYGHSQSSWGVNAFLTNIPVSGCFAWESFF
jgi:hypothetical protein